MTRASTYASGRVLVGDPLDPSSTPEILDISTFSDVGSESALALQEDAAWQLAQTVVTMARRQDGANVKPSVFLDAFVAVNGPPFQPVSYTHLTLPTILLV